MNSEMLATLHLCRLLLFQSGPPDTITVLLQAMDPLFGLLKTILFDNLEVVWEEWLSKPDVKETMTSKRCYRTFACWRLVGFQSPVF